MAATQISRSLRFNSADSAYLNRTPASAGNRKTWTWSAWVKRSQLSGIIFIQNPYSGANDYDRIWFTSSDNLQFDSFIAASTSISLITTQVFRDPSAWYHIIYAVDTTQATSSNRVKLYVNGTQVTAFSTATYPAQNAETWFNSTAPDNIGRAATNVYYYGGYLTEINFIGGLALTPASFGQTNSSTGVWEPRQYTGPYGTNGFYLNFSDNSNTTATTLGKDYSGNGNNWTPNNFSVTAGAGNDSLVDTPTSYGTDTGVGGEVRGNYATWNPLDQLDGSLANGNLDSTTGTVGGSNCRGTFGMSSGKWYFECTPITNGGIANIGISVFPGLDAKNGTFYTYQADDGNKATNSGSTAFGSTYTTNDVIGVAFDASAGKVWFAKNGTWQASGNPASGTNEAYSSISTPAFPFLSDRNVSQTCTVVLNAGQRPFAYTAPSGFKALCTQNLPTPTIGATSTTQANKYMDVTLYTGNGAVRSITNSGSMQPDFVWDKLRSGGNSHRLFDAVRGVEKALYSNLTNAETTETGTLTSFNSDGFSLGTNNETNTNTSTYVAWQWNAGGSNATNTSGTITSTVRANTTAGFSIVTYTGNSTASATVGHGLGVTPRMIIVKNRSAVQNWPVAHTSLAANNLLTLDTTGASTSAGTRLLLGNSTTFTVGDAADYGITNQTGQNYVAYCFAAVAGYSAFGSYTGNGSTDGPFVYTGFRPRFILIKRSDSGAENWRIVDTARGPYNVFGIEELYPNSSAAEGGVGTANFIDALSNGFKLRNTGSGVNANGGTYIYAAFAESPFKYALAR
jgi:hypothetical protein